MLQWISANVPPLQLPPDGTVSLYFDPKERQFDLVIGDLADRELLAQTAMVAALGNLLGITPLEISQN
jgi:hypothetical protein